VSNAKFGFLTNITLDIQAQISNKANTTDLTTTNSSISTLQTSVNLKGGLSSDNTWSGTNTYNSYIPTTTLTPTLSSQFITKAYADSNYAGTGILSGTNTWTGSNVYNLNLPTSTKEPTSSTEFTNKAYVDLKAPTDSPTFTGSLTLSYGDIKCTNINSSTAIYCNQYKRNVNANSGGYCYIFDNATIDD